MLRSNFTTVRMSADGATLQVTGISDAGTELLELRITVASPKPPDPAKVGEDLAPLADQVEQAVAAPIEEPWTIAVPITPGMFERGDTVVLSGSALRWQPERANGIAEGVHLTVESWIGCTTVMSESDAKT